LRDGVLSFDRLDERLPFPIPDDAREVVPFYPAILELSQYTLKITALAPGQYVLKINGVAAAELSAEQLNAGVNLTALGPASSPSGDGPIAAQGRAILAAVAAKEGLVSQWRALQKAQAGGAAGELSEQLAALTTSVEQADAKIREAAQPQKLHFELGPAK
jgi:hypothetical protein